MNNININKLNKIYCIGIGGIGISAAARILNQLGKQVSGSDATSSEITDQLKKEGIEVFIPQSENNIPADTELIVHTVAVAEDNEERIKAKELGLKQITYPELLGLLMKGKYGIGLSGTDGKTTTTAILGKIFIDAKLDPTIVIGSKVGYLGGNSTVGKGKHFIFESDEYKKAFHNYYPQIAGLTNVRADHLDVYKDLKDVKKAFTVYLKRVPKDGKVIINGDDSNCKDVSSGIGAKIITYGIDNDVDVRAKNIRYDKGKQKFSVVKNDKSLGEVTIGLPGKYNVYNTLLAITIALEEGISFKAISLSLSSFKGAWRRFEKLGKYKKTEVFTDYAHTPEGLKQVILAGQELYKDKKVLFVFQPHQYNRTKNFFDDFVLSLKTADNIIVSDIFFVAGRENPKDFDVSSKKLAKEASIEYSGDIKKTEKIVKEKIADFDVVIFTGAGDIYNLAKKFAK